MSLQNLQREYRMANADLIATARRLISFIKRDAADFAQRNVDAARIAQLEDAYTGFSDTLDDVAYRGWVSAAILEKDNKRLELERSIRAIRNMAEVQYKGKGYYLAFGFERLSRLPDDRLYRTARRIARLAALFLPDLQAQGLSQAMIDALVAKTDEFSAVLDAVDVADEERDVETVRRMLLANELYDMMVTLASVGKSIYEDEDEARWNDYVI